jgi:hypothetical protein
MFSYEFGEMRYKVVYDPFCNSSLASRGILDAAAGMSVFDYDGMFLASAIMDYQTGGVGYVERGVATEFYQLQSGAELTFDRRAPESLEDAWVVFTLENTAERSHITEGFDILKSADRVITSSGHVYLRCSAGCWVCGDGSSRARI